MEDRAKAESLMEFCAAVNKANERAVSIVLIGSVARGSETPKSDIDLLLLGSEKPRIPGVPKNFHIHLSDEVEFLRKLREGDDLAAWCVRYGVPIEDRGHWRQVTSSPEANTWPDWRKKILHATRRLLLAKVLLDMGDLEAASEETLYAASHVARTALLKANIFPLSRSELVLQSKEAGLETLASILRELLWNEVDQRFLRRAHLYLKKLLCDFDKAEYKRHAQALSRLVPVSKTRHV